MKHYAVDVDITMSCRIEVDAENEEQAKNIVGNWIGDDHMYYMRDGHYVSHEFEAVSECEEKPNPKKAALDYVRSQLQDYELDVYCSEISASYEMHSTPTACYDFDHIRDLLEEYGEENDLPEGWWESEGDLDDWLYEL